MTGVAQQVQGGTFSKVSRGRILSIRDYLVGEYLLGASKTESVKNRANPALPLLEVGVVSALTITAAGSGGTNGTFALIFTGGNPTTPAAGTFTVSGGAVTATAITNNGVGYQSAPTISLANSAGLTGATVTATRAGPTYNAHSAVIRPSLTAGFGYRTQIIPDENFTWLLVRKNATVAGAKPTVMGMNVAISNANLFGFRENGDGNNYGSAGETSNLSTAGSAYRTQPAAGTIYFEAIVHNPLDYTDFYYGAGGVLTRAPNAAAGQATIARSTGTPGAYIYSEVLIGSAGLTDTITTNSDEVLFAALYNRSLAQAEVNQGYADVRAFEATLGVTVV